MKKKSNIPKNKFGIFACHTQSGRELTKKEIKAIIDGPIAAMQDKLTEELTRPAYVS